MSIFDWPLSMLQCILYLEEVPQKLQKCYNFKLYFCLVWFVWVFPSKFESSLCMVIALFPYLLFLE